MKKTKQKNLAKRVAISPQWLSDIINGRGTPGGSLMLRLARETKSTAEDWASGDRARLTRIVDDYLAARSPDDNNYQCPTSNAHATPATQAKIRTLGMLATAAGITAPQLYRIRTGKSGTRTKTAQKLGRLTHSDYTDWIGGNQPAIQRAIEVWQYGRTVSFTDK